ncbi:MAG TPA: hypothetical protein VF290_09645 [Pyrinomonadaceae bacterium]
MKRNFFKRPSAVTLVVLGSAALGIASIAGAGISRSLTNTATTDIANKSQLVAVKTQVAQAQVPVLPDQANEVAKLVNKSHTVVLAAVVSNESHLSADKQSVVTDYRVEARDVLKGNLKSGETTTVSMAGGLVLFHPDGSEVTKAKPLKNVKNDEAVTVAVNTSPEPQVSLAGVGSTKAETAFESTPMMNGQSYLLFLVRKEGGGFAVASSGKGLQAIINAADPAMPKLLSDVRLAVSKQK